MSLESSNCIQAWDFIVFPCVLIIWILFRSKYTSIITPLVNSFIKKNPYRKKNYLNEYSYKITDHSIRLLFHLIVTIWGLITFSRKDWFFYTTHNIIKTKMEDGFILFKLYYLFQAAYHVHSLVHFLLYEKNRADYSMMNVHHIVTLALICASYLLGYFYLCIGALLFFIHDISDVFVSIAKIINYMGASQIVVLFTFFLLFLTWAYFRIYMFAVYIIIPAAGGIWQMWISENISVTIILRTILLFLLIALFILHFVWFLMFFRVGNSIAKGNSISSSVDIIEDHIPEEEIILKVIKKE